MLMWPVDPVPGPSFGPSGASLSDLSLGGLPLTDESFPTPGGCWYGVELTTIMRLKFAHCRPFRQIGTSEGNGEISGFAFCEKQSSVEAMLFLWPERKALDADQLLLALQDPTGRVRAALTQSLRSIILMPRDCYEFPEEILAPVLRSRGLVCIGQERLRMGEIEIYLAD